MVQEVTVKREFEAWLPHAASGKLLSVNPAVNGSLFRIRRDKAAKGDGWAQPFISCAQDTVGL